LAPRFGPISSRYNSIQAVDRFSVEEFLLCQKAFESFGSQRWFGGQMRTKFLMNL